MAEPSDGRSSGPSCDAAGAAALGRREPSEYTANRRIGMEWVGETGKYYDLELQVYRLRAADLDRPIADQQFGADQHR